MILSNIRFPFRQVAPDLANFLFTFIVATIVVTPAIAADGVPDRCTKCHTEAKIVEKVTKMPANERARKLEAFLTKHYAPDSTERAAIVAALKAMAEKR